MASTPDRVPASPEFPLLGPHNHEVTSPETPRYNCIAWAAGDEWRWWWPDPDGVAYWPLAAPREETIAAFAAAYGTLGYLPCADGSSEPGHEKIAVYPLADSPTHAARQLADGRWPSKLGSSVDIAHSLEALEGPLYGTAVRFLRRAIG